jgi:hypothetical protein
MAALRAIVRTAFDIIDECICKRVLGMGVDYDSCGNITLQHHENSMDMLTKFNKTVGTPPLRHGARKLSLSFMMVMMTSTMPFLTLTLWDPSYGHQFAPAITSQHMCHV